MNNIDNLLMKQWSNLFLSISSYYLCPLTHSLICLISIAITSKQKGCGDHLTNLHAPGPNFIFSISDPTIPRYIPTLELNSPQPTSVVLLVTETAQLKHHFIAGPIQTLNHIFPCWFRTTQVVPSFPEHFAWNALTSAWEKVKHKMLKQSHYL